MREGIRRTLLGFGLVLIAATLLPIAPSNEWWVRFFDFPRVQIGVLIVLTVAAAVAASMWRSRDGQALIAALVLSLYYQVSRILPYTPPWPEEVPAAPECSPAERLRYMAANVHRENRNAEALLDLVRARRPDVLLLTETDAWWAAQVRPLMAEMPHVVGIPQENTYGMMLLSRRPLLDTEVRYLFDPHVPSIRAEIELGAGKRIALYGVHPRPPVPGRDTANRDAELVLVGREARARRMPTIVAGDLNDVAWSDTTALFQEVSGLLDPRVGRRLIPTFPADLPLLRWPLDYVFVSPGFGLLRIERLRDIGSDHLPIFVELCAADVAFPKLPPPKPAPEVRQEVREVIRESREEAAEQ